MLRQFGFGRRKKEGDTTGVFGARDGGRAGMVYASDGSRRPTSGRAGGAYSARGVGSSSFASPGRDGGMSPYAGVRATSGRAGPSVKPKEFKFSFEADPGAAQPPTKSRPLSAGPTRGQVRQSEWDERHPSVSAPPASRTSPLSHHHRSPPKEFLPKINYAHNNQKDTRGRARGVGGGSREVKL